MASQTGPVLILFLALEDIPNFMDTSNKLFPGVIDTSPVTTTPEVTPFQKIWIGCLEVNDEKVFVCLYDI
jgi:hypothetical protein